MDAAVGAAPAKNGLVSCGELRLLEVRSFAGSPAQLAQLLEAAPCLPELRLESLYHWRDKAESCALRQLLAAAQMPAAVCKALSHLQCEGSREHHLTSGILALTSLTRLDFCVHYSIHGERPLLQFPESFSRLRWVGSHKLVCWRGALLVWGALDAHVFMHCPVAHLSHARQAQANLARKVMAAGAFVTSKYLHHGWRCQLLLGCCLSRA